MDAALSFRTLQGGRWKNSNAKNSDKKQNLAGLLHV
jgi:hypothetical protein